MNPTKRSKLTLHAETLRNLSAPSIREVPFTATTSALTC